MSPTQRTILYIEDDPASRKLVERTLRHAGYRVAVAERGLQGLDLARSLGPDLVLIDINLPDLSGRELTTLLRCDARFRYTPIVALTAQGPEGRELTLAAGITGYLSKPLDMAALPQIVEYYLHGGRDDLDPARLSEARAEYSREVVLRLESRIRELEALNHSLYQLDQMKDTFIQLTAHELRTPLTLVYGYSRLLSDHPPLQNLMQYDENIRGLVQGLTEAIERMRNIINEILTISRIMTNQIELNIGPTNLGAIVRNVVTGFEQALFERRLILHFDQSQFPAMMKADGELLRLALANLVSNAIKYTPDGGHITITAQYNDEHVRISVRDTGIGIDKADQPLIFERFHTTRDVAYHTTSKTAFGGGGLGLGLPICKGIVEAHGGQIWVESAGYDPERLPGSEVIIILPLMTNAAKTPSVIRWLEHATG